MAADALTRSAINDVFEDTFSDFERDPFADNPTTKDQRDDKPTLSPRAAKRKAGDGADGDIFGLGLDEEVKITKKRKPIAKLDEARLLSEPGIPKIRSLIRSGQISRKLRLKGKGHEFSDAARLLNYYQLWLDNLYPRAKFADALHMVEKAGHTKRMQMTRSEWINESKPGYRPASTDVHLDTELRPDEDPDLFANIDPSAGGGNDNDQSAKTTSYTNEAQPDSMFIPDDDVSFSAVDQPNNDPDDDELDALLAQQDFDDFPRSRTSPRQESRIVQEDASEGEDDLDALLAEQETQRIQKQDLAARENIAYPSRDEESVAPEEDELDALLAEQQQVQEPEQEQETQESKPDELDVMLSSSPVPDDDAFVGIDDI